MKPNDLPLINKTVEHLLRMRQVLLDRPEERFDMTYWQRPSSCGTVCCLLGSYIEAYGDETGLRLYKPETNYLPRPICIGNEQQEKEAEEMYLITDSMFNVAEALGLKYDDCQYLFSPNYYSFYGYKNTKTMVLERLDMMIKKYSKGG